MTEGDKGSPSVRTPATAVERVNRLDRVKQEGERTQMPEMTSRSEEKENFHAKNRVDGFPSHPAPREGLFILRFLPFSAKESEWYIPKNPRCSW